MPSRRSLLTAKQIVVWADAHNNRTGAWPRCNSGPVRDAPGETWIGIDFALRKGIGGLRKSSLARLLAKHRGMRNHMALPRLTYRKILAWADAQKQRTGKWPTSEAGPVTDAPGEKWWGIHDALSHGSRGLPGGSSLPGLLAKHRNARNRVSAILLTEGLIRQWAEEHRQRTGQWPRQRSGPVERAPGETWKLLDQALRKGHRGLPGGSSLAELLARGL